MVCRPFMVSLGMLCLFTIVFSITLYYFRPVIIQERVGAARVFCGPNKRSETLHWKRCSAPCVQRPTELWGVCRHNFTVYSWIHPRWIWLHAFMLTWYPIGSMVLVYMLTWMGYIDGIHVTIYSSTMDPGTEFYIKMKSVRVMAMSRVCPATIFDSDRWHARHPPLPLREWAAQQHVPATNLDKPEGMAGMGGDITSCQVRQGALRHQQSCLKFSMISQLFHCIVPT